MTDKKPPHRPKGTFISIDWEQVNKMCAIQCTGEEIANVLGVDYDTLASACKRENKMLFSDYIGQRKSDGKMSLRPTMLVWLGKNWLKQTDKSEVAITEHKITGFEVVADES